LVFKNKDTVSDYVSTDPRIKLERKFHTEDSNKDSLADLETVNIHIIDTLNSDEGYYLCIVANSLKSFRVTYGFLKIVDIPLYKALFNSLFVENNYTIIGLIIAVILLIFLLIVSYHHCIYVLNTKNKKTDNQKNLLNGKLPNENSSMNNLIEKTISSMKKVRIYYFIIFKYNLI
jgi:hypothetical protein